MPLGNFQLPGGDSSKPPCGINAGEILEDDRLRVCPTGCEFKEGDELPCELGDPFIATLGTPSETLRRYGPSCMGLAAALPLVGAKA